MTITGNLLIGKLDGNIVVSGLDGEVLDGAATVPIVAASHLGLGRALDGQTQTTLTGALGLHREFLRLVCYTALET